MQIRKGIIEAIGNTPLIKLAHASKATGCIILGKAEFMNPGGSVKDRAGRADDRGGREARRTAAPADSSSRRPPAIPASASPWSPMRAATAR